MPPVNFSNTTSQARQYCSSSWCAPVEKLPVMVTPSWVDTPTQPIGIEESGGLSGRSAVLAGRSERDLRDRRAWTVDWMATSCGICALRSRAPDAASAGAHPRTLQSLARPGDAALRLRAGADQGVRQRDRGTRQPGAPGLRRAPARGPGGVGSRAVNEDLGFAATRWSDAFSSRRMPRSWGGVRFRSRRVDSRAAWVELLSTGGLSPYRPDRRQDRWYFGNRLWRLRGLLDRLVGGPGCEGDGGTPKRFVPVMRWTSGGSRRWSLIVCSGLRRRCGCRAGPGCSSRSHRRRVGA